jgi:predicted DNA-binding WGR domain protein
MTAPQQTAPTAKAIESISLFNIDPVKNHDKEYHVQVVKVDESQFLVNFQYGRRGTNLRHGTKTDTPVSERTARTLMENIVYEKRQKGYRLMKLGQVREIYAAMIAAGMDGVGCDLYMRRGSGALALKEYAALAGAAASEAAAMTNSYAARREISGVFALVNPAAPDPKALAACVKQVKQLLSTSNLDEMGVFLGHKDADGLIREGLPQAHAPAMVEEPRKSTRRAP